MAIILLGKSCCPLCGCTFQAEDDIVVFPGIISNEDDPLFAIRDTAFHAACLTSHPLALQAKERMEEWQERTSSGRRCYRCGKSIDTPDEHWIFPHFTSDPAHLLHEFNFREFHQSCLKTWERMPSILAAIDELQQAGLWKGPALRHIARTFG